MALHVTTPVFEDHSLSVELGCKVSFKMDCFQPSGSFKIRGIGTYCTQAYEAGKTHLICASGGNAGYATAYAGRKLGMKVTIVVPETTKAVICEKIRAQGAEVIVKGAVWDETAVFAKELANADHCCYVPPFDHPLLWDGHATVVDELVQQTEKPDLIIVAVGGGGYFCGLMQGLAKHNWTNTDIVVAETKGTASLAASLSAGKLTTLEKIDSIATTLGAKTVAAKAFEFAQAAQAKPVVVSDQAAVEAVETFFNQFNILVEPSCGAALAVLYGQKVDVNKYNHIMVLVCGGRGFSLNALETFKSALR